MMIDDVGFSDHCLVRCKVDMDIKRQPIVRASFRNWKKLNLDMFKQRIRLSSAFTEPATTAEEFASQLEVYSMNWLSFAPVPRDGDSRRAGGCRTKRLRRSRPDGDSKGSGKVLSLMLYG